MSNPDRPTNTRRWFVEAVHKESGESKQFRLQASTEADALKYVADQGYFASKVLPIQEPPLQPALPLPDITPKKPPAFVFADRLLGFADFLNVIGFVGVLVGILVGVVGLGVVNTSGEGMSALILGVAVAAYAFGLLIMSAMCGVAGSMCIIMQDMAGDLRVLREAKEPPPESKS
jgi:hypothetical protein